MLFFDKAYIRRVSNFIINDSISFSFSKSIDLLLNFEQSRVYNSSKLQRKRALRLYTFFRFTRLSGDLWWLRLKLVKY